MSRSPDAGEMIEAAIQSNPRLRVAIQRYRYSTAIRCAAEIAFLQPDDMRCALSARGRERLRGTLAGLRDWCDRMEAAIDENTLHSTM